MGWREVPRKTRLSPNPSYLWIWPYLELGLCCCNERKDLKWDYPGFGVSSKSNDCSHWRKEREIKIQKHRGRGHLEAEAEMRAIPLEPKNARRHPKQEKARKDSPLGASEGAWPCWHLDFGPLATETVRQYISVVRSYRFCGTWKRKLMQGLSEMLSNTHQFGDTVWYVKR